MSASRILLFSFWLGVDHFWLLLRCNLLTLLLALPVVTFPAGLAGLLHVCARIIARQKTTMKDYFEGMRRFSGRTYLLSAGMALLWAWSILAFVFYSRQTPLIASAGITLAAVILACGGVFAYLLLPSLLRSESWKQRAGQCARLILEEPLSVLKFVVAVGLVKILLVLTGAGFLCFGAVWPLTAVVFLWMEYRRIRNGEPVYIEDRGWKDFFVPPNLLK